jgi:PTS system nitrogen regulatory IIA component
MDLSDLVTPDAILPALKANSKKQVLQAIAEKAALMTGVQEKDILETLIKREKLGSTGVGGGIAIPHGKLAGLNRIFGLFARLPKPIDFEALDDHPVDLIFLLLAPENAGADHLKALARVARLFREPGVVGKLRVSSDASALYAVLTEGATHNAA